MKLVWIIIPLVLIGIIGIQESFAIESEIMESVIAVRGIFYENGTTQLLDWYYLESEVDIPLDNPGDLKILYFKNNNVIAETGIPYGVSCYVHSKEVCRDYNSFLSRIPDVIGVTKYTLQWNDKILAEVDRKSLIDAKTVFPQSKNYEQIDEEKAKRLAELHKSNITHLSPKKQMAMGVTVFDVVCREGLQLIFKSTNGYPSCVKSSSAEKLIERGWALDRGPIYTGLLSTEECKEQGGKYNHCPPCPEGAFCEPCTEFCRIE